MKTVENFNFAGKKAVVRVDFNVPLDENFNIRDYNRINAALPTIKKILADGGAVVLMSHLGRPKDGPEDRFSLKHIVKALEEKLGTSVAFANDCVGEEASEKAAALKGGEVLLLENLRFHKEEKKGDEDFAKKLASLGDVWVMDAFGTAHRAHASTAVIGKFVPEKVAGFVLAREVENAQKVLKNGERPLTAIMGGAKISDKILIIENLLDSVDNLIVGGGMTYTFIKAMGGSIGNSLCEDDRLDIAKALIEKAKAKGVNLMLPTDDAVADAFSNDADIKVTKAGETPEGYMGLDIGPETQEAYAKVISESKTILWNGPMGVFEMSNFAAGTIGVAKAVVAATENGGFSLIGGGDSAAAVNTLGFGDKVSYVSTGGGALLEFMEGKVLPGIAALEA
ncbi:phosphoglycerate kinase [Fulvitalea axinellae]|uniref:Phosphoglycerate kinase n=1 Tax=Fulvitalea axinellae TaxID=1182444 RepID=A0AAU9D9J4_9BACT|nr:phosphoglycerate kinase [Fulvitalea axinellae]